MWLKSPLKHLGRAHDFSGVLELFPYGLDEATLPQFATLATLRGLKYRSWINADKALSKVIGKLPKIKSKTLESILAMDHVPNFKCCFDPALKIKLGQVTKVDADDLKNTLEELMILEGDDNEHDQDESWIIPSQVQVLRLHKLIFNFQKNPSKNCSSMEKFGITFLEQTSQAFL